MRHGATAWNIADRFQGTTETMLHPIGRDQALINAKAVEAFIRAGQFQRDEITIVSSPLARARQTASIVAERLGLENTKIQTITALREISLGRWEGMNNLRVKEVYYEERQSRKLDRWNFRPQGGESLAERADGVKAALASLDPHSVVITHAGILRIALHVLGSESIDDAASASLPHEGLLHFDGTALHRMFATT
ncbi:histidine phosphatase family protein [Pseudahrensia aquimaris]|uniref:Histidine phosphatase family protein n=1 Tax=Pseudahrensia aquimaris TaxID=744461 RepID=A0ABW3FDH9_9HYPH